MAILYHKDIGMYREKMGLLGRIKLPPPEYKTGILSLN